LLLARPHQARAKLRARAPAGIISTSITEENGAIVFRHACKRGLEGIVLKRLSAPYRSGPSRDWIKVKNPDSPAMRQHRAGTW
jgi:bifunctional non-homologous end joining protein LigD